MGSGLSLRGKEMVRDKQESQGELWGRGVVYVLFLELGAGYTFALEFFSHCAFMVSALFKIYLHFAT